MVICMQELNDMRWVVRIPKRVYKNISALPAPVKETLFMLLSDIQDTGAVQGNWPNYGKLAKNKHHCHLKKGKPCYVAVWEVTDKKIRLIEVQYVGTHENAPY